MLPIARVSGTCHVWRRIPVALALAVALGGSPARAAGAPDSLVALETSLGTIRIRLFDQDAPVTTANFRRLAREGFYDGTCFHRAVPGFVIQGGDPNSRNANPTDDGLGGPGYTLPPEPGRRHVRGAVAMARKPDLMNPGRESNGSQFYIVIQRQPSLDAGGGTVFGEVVAGLDVVDRIAALALEPDVRQTPAGANPCEHARIVRATLEPALRKSAAR
jgi:cyclophilin family peptidyl-prolyl cis-trans isomerase